MKLERIPKHEYIKHPAGFFVITNYLMKLYHKNETRKRFWKWMTGQTGTILPNNEIGAYSWDYERWLESGMPDKQGRNWD